MTDPESRRRFLRASGALAGMAAFGSLLPARARTASAVPVTLGLRSDRSGLRVSPRLTGLSYETLQLLDPGFFAPQNETLIAFLRTLNPEGVLRIGGNTSDFSVWSGYRGTLPAFTQVPHATFERPYVITPAQLANLADFLRATGWRLIFGLNLRADRPDMAAQLAEAVQRAAGDHLLALQIGNEPNDDPGADGKPIDFDEYFQRWRRTARAVRTRVSVPLAGPDTGANTDWVIRFAREAHGLAALTRHYYRGGAPEAASTITQLLAGDPGFFASVAKVRTVAARRHLPFILSEVNSYWGGGKLGISNTFAAALWGGDFALACAQAGAQSVDFHGGPLAIVEASLGKAVAATATHADRMERLDAISARYAPIAGDVGQGFYARPLYYGLLLAQQFAGAHFIGHDLDARGVNLTAYAGTRDGTRMLALFNKDLQRDAKVSVKLDARAGRARIRRLQAPGIEDVHHTRFADAQVDSDGHWVPRSSEILPVTAGSRVSLDLPHASAALVRLDT